MNLHFCHVCKEIRDTADGFCVMCHAFLGRDPQAFANATPTAQGAGQTGKTLITKGWKSDA